MAADQSAADDRTEPRQRPQDRPLEDRQPDDRPPEDGPEAEVWRMHVEELIEAAVRRVQPPWAADETLAPLIAERERRSSPPAAGAPAAAAGRPRRSGGPIGRPRVGLGSGPSAELRVRVGQDVLNALATSASIRGMTVATLVRQMIDEQLGGEEDPEELLDPEEAAAWRLHPAGRTLGGGADRSPITPRCSGCGMTTNDDGRVPAGLGQIPTQRGLPLTDDLLDAIGEEVEDGFTVEQLRGTTP